MSDQDSDGKDEETGPGLEPDQLQQIVSQFEQEEEASIESALASQQSLELWLNQHPALRQLIVPESLSAVAAGILELLRNLFRRG